MQGMTSDVATPLTCTAIFICGHHLTAKSISVWWPRSICHWMAWSKRGPLDWSLQQFYIKLLETGKDICRQFPDSAVQTHGLQPQHLAQFLSCFHIATESLEPSWSPAQRSDWDLSVVSSHYQSQWLAAIMFSVLFRELHKSNQITLFQINCMHMPNSCRMQLDLT